VEVGQVTVTGVLPRLLAGPAHEVRMRTLYNQWTQIKACISSVIHKDIDISSSGVGHKLRSMSQVTTKGHPDCR
jgi:hypothetical protein